MMPRGSEILFARFLSLEKLARFVGLAPDELASGQSHANRAVLSKDNLLRDVDREWFEVYARVI